MHASRSRSASLIRPPNKTSQLWVHRWKGSIIRRTTLQAMGEKKSYAAVTSVTGPGHFGELFLTSDTNQRTGETKMRKTTSFAIAGALILAGIAGWAATSTQARVVAPSPDAINPLQIMLSATQLPVQHYKDYSVVFD